VATKKAKSGSSNEKQPSPKKSTTKKDMTSKNVTPVSASSKTTATTKTRTSNLKSTSDKVKAAQKKVNTKTTAAEPSNSPVKKKQTASTEVKSKTAAKNSQNSSLSKGTILSNDKVKNTPQEVSKKSVATQSKTAKTSSPRKKNTNKNLPTTIIAKVDVGYGNSVYIRGEGGGLNWENGILMENTGNDEWSWQTKANSGVLSFKFLINDQYWCSGENFVSMPGETSIWTPTF
jgi:hypothetical protein